MPAKRKFILGSHAKKQIEVSLIRFSVAAYLTFLAASSSGMVDAVSTYEWRGES